jgi:hypothetical protein
MKKLHITLVAGLLAAAAVLGTFAATHTVSLGAAHTRAGQTKVLARAKQLDRFEASLRRALARRPPALPTVPTATASGAEAPSQQPRVVYRRPPAIVVVRHLHHGDDGGGREAADSEGGGGGGD